MIAVLALAACHPSPSPVPPEPDVVTVDAQGPAPVLDAADPYVAVCMHLQLLGCSDVPDAGAYAVAQCAATMARAEQGPMPLTHFDRACLLAAPSKASARACGGVDCL